MKRSISIILAMLMLCLVFASCGDETKDNTNTQTSSNSVAETQTSSVATSSKKGTVNRGDDDSQTESSGIKEFKNPGTVMLGCFHLSPEWCTYYGSDFESKMKQFEEIVSQQYFNTYLMGVNEYFPKAVEIVAKYGGTVWIGAGKYKSSGGKTLDSTLENYDFYFDMLKKKGLYDIVNGFYWDEPFLAGVTNADFQYQTKTFYQRYGLRNFPVLATSAFSESEGNQGIDTSNLKKANAEGLKYVTDIAYDAYSVDVREGVREGQTSRYAKWSKAFGYEIKNGKDYYIGIKKALQKATGHDANYWYYPTAYKTGLWGGANGEDRATEDFCIEMLKFMTEDVLKEKYPGGLIIYNYHKFGANGAAAFEEFCDAKDSSGKYLHYPTAEKWVKYSELLRETTKKFNQMKQDVVKLDV